MTLSAGTRLGPYEILSPLGVADDGRVFAVGHAFNELPIFTNWLEELRRLVPAR